jgi:hypothetical protein
MHQVISAIVYAEDKEEALDNAKGIFDGLVEEGVFDYYRTFDEDGSGISGRDRWGDLPVCAEADSQEGKKLIDDEMKYTKDEFMENIKKIRETLSKFSDEDLFSRDEDNSDVNLFRYHCYWIGQHKGTSVWLYNDDGDGIRSEEELNRALDKYVDLYKEEGEENPYTDDTVWVVPADVHK